MNTSDNDNIPLMLSTEQAAKLLNVSPSVLARDRFLRGIEGATVPYVKIGGQVRYRRVDIEAITGGALIGETLRAPAPATKVRKKTRSMRWLPFEEARELAHSKGFDSMQEYRAARKTDPSLCRVPASPDLVYNEWVSQADWLGKQSGTRGGYRERLPVTYDEARAMLAEKGIKSIHEYTLARRAGLLPGMPADIRNFFRGRGWVSTEHLFSLDDTQPNVAA
jgi:hypothetical protein